MRRNNEYPSIGRAAALLLALALAGCESATGPSSEKSMLSFSFASPAIAGVIDEAAGTVLATTISACDKTSMTPTISVSAGASVSPASGTAQDFTAPVVYTVTAEDGTAREYAVKVRTLAITTDPTSGLVIHVFVPSPTNVDLVRGSRSVTVTWDPVDGATGYEVHYAKGGTATIFSPQAPASAVSGCGATVTGLLGGTRYSFAVVAFKGGSESEASGSVSCYTLLEPPTGLVATGGPKRVTLYWTAPSGDVGGYRVHCREGDTATSSDPLATSSMLGSASASVTGLGDGKKYAFVVEAVRSGYVPETGPASAVATATTDFVLRQQTDSGGYVFYDKGTYADGWRYMEVTPGAVDMKAPYSGQYGYSRKPSTSTAIGSGMANTGELVECFGSAVSCAATICSNYGLNGYTDWFLPSKDEMYEVFKALYKFKSSYTAVIAWTSSTDRDSDSGWYQIFESNITYPEGAQVLAPYSAEYAVFAVRRF